MADIIVFGEDYGAHPSSTQHLMNRLSAHHRVIWLNSIGLRAPRMTHHDVVRVLRKAWRMLRTPAHASHTSPPFPVLQPCALPLPASYAARWLNRHMLRWQIRRMIRTHQLKEPILWASLPSAVDAICPAVKRVIYYCGDDFSQLDGVDHAAIARMEEELVERADVIMAASEALVARLPADKTHYLPHGVDLALFTQTTTRPALFHEQRPRACFYGSIAPWVRIDWIAQAAKALPEWEFVMIGHVKTDVSALHDCENVRFVGAVAHDALVGYASHVDVLLMPFHDNGQIHHCNPLKLYEYLAIGTPIVATHFPAMRAYATWMHVAHDATSFITALQDARKEGQARAAERRACVAQQDWQQRSNQVEAWL